MQAFRKFLCFFLLGFLLFPYLQGKFHLFKIKPLSGAITYSPDTKISFRGWLSGEYQSLKEPYINEEFGFRNIFLRINNQLFFDIFNKASADGVVIGKENYLYEINYIKAAYGLDFIGEDSIAHRMEKLKFVQDTLTKLNKTLLLVLAPGKATFFPEYIPDKYKENKGNTNYNCTIKIADSLGINVIDFNKYFVANKNTSKYRLYSKYGIHWSIYGEFLAADSIIRYIENTCKIRIPHIYWNTVAPEDPKGRENDIEDGMNLLFDLKKDKKLGHPDYHVQSDSGKTMLSSVVISDSYYWGMYDYMPRVFSVNNFWYYNHDIYPETFKNPLTTEQVDLKNEITKHDVIIIMCTDANLPKLGWGFIENAYNLFKGIQPSKKYDLYKINNLKATIKLDKNWMVHVAEDAKNKGISLDSALTLNAIWEIQHSKN